MKIYLRWYLCKHLFHSSGSGIPIRVLRVSIARVSTVRLHGRLAGSQLTAVQYCTAVNWHIARLAESLSASQLTAVQYCTAVTGRLRVKKHGNPPFSLKIQADC